MQMNKVNKARKVIRKTSYFFESLKLKKYNYKTEQSLQVLSWKNMYT